MTTIAHYGTTERREQDRAMIEDPMRWPNMRLPLKNPKRYNTDDERAYGWLAGPSLGWQAPGPRIVIFGNIFGGPSGGEERFEDVDALLDAGWTVD